MSQLIASTYEIREKLGAGGIGTVYRGWHMRLDKAVVLKVEQRTLKTDLTELRREVNLLKDLSHTYIPQVYDFVTEKDMVYTVMDYIDGKSMDVLLRQDGWAPSQAEIIGWARQLLEALCYLHSQPPYGILHGDIKPANIMLTPQGDIRLIDFNIALALGEEGAVQVGHSRGYASPEHYGIDYSTRRRVTQSAGGVHSTTNGAVPILLDVRSDIYCLGATLYHLLTGEPPAEDAKDVVPIRSQSVSRAVASIIQKAMAPDPDERYQTAREMLDAFEGLYTNDPRAKRHRRNVRISAAVLTAVFLIGGVSAFTGLRQRERLQAEAAEQARIAEELERREKQALSDITRSEDAYRAGNAPEAVRLARSALDFHTSYDARAQNALTEALGVYDLSGSFRPHLLLELPGEAIKADLSPAGTRAAAIAGGELRVFDTESGEMLAALPVTGTALADFVFLSEDIVAYAGEDALRCYDLAAKAELWSGQPATAIAASADGATVAAAYRDNTTATLYDTATGLVRQTVELQGGALHAVVNDTMIDPEYDLFALNADGSMLVVGSYESGVLWTYNLTDRDMDFQLDFQPQTCFEGGFHGPYLAVTAWDGETSIFAVIDAVHLVQTGGYDQPMRFHVQADESGIYFAAGRLLVKMDPETFAEEQLAYGDSYILGTAVSGDGTAIVKTEDGRVSIFDADAALLNTWDGQEQCTFLAVAGHFALAASRDAPTLTIRRLEDYSQEQLLSYDKAYTHTEARLSSGGETVTLFHYNHFWILDVASGEILADMDIPESDQVYDQEFRRDGDGDGDRLEVTYYSGLMRVYSALDGSVMLEKQGEAPDKDIVEDFYTDRYRIQRSLHGTPIVYDRETGEQMGMLEPEDYLTYLTQVGDDVMTEYVSTQSGERYGLLLNENLEVLAKLPGLCDVFEDGRLIFDDNRGNLRESHIYSAEELMALSKQYS